MATIIQDILIGKAKQILRIQTHQKATVNILSEQDYHNLNPKPRLWKPTTKMETSLVPVVTIGETRALLHTQSTKTIAIFHIIAGTTKSVLNLRTAQELAIVPVIRRAPDLLTTLQAGKQEKLNSKNSKNTPYRENGKKTVEQDETKKPSEQNTKRDETKKPSEQNTKKETKNKEPTPATVSQNYGAKTEHVKPTRDDKMHDEEENPNLSSSWKDNITKSTQNDISPIKKNTEKINKHACSEETNITTATGIYAKFHFQKHIHNIRVKKNPKTHVNLFQKKQIPRTRNLDHNTQLHTHSYFTTERNDSLKYTKFRKKLNTSESPSKTKNVCTLNFNQDTRIHTHSDLTTEQNDFFIHSKFPEKYRMDKTN